MCVCVGVGVCTTSVPLFLCLGCCLGYVHSLVPCLGQCLVVSGGIPEGGHVVVTVKVMVVVMWLRVVS